MAKRGWTKRALEMKAKLEELERSGKTQAAFARSEGIPLSNLGYWRRRLRELGSALPPSPSESPLLPVHIIDSRPVSAFELQTRQGHVLRVPHGFDESDLRKLMRVVESC